MRKEIRSRLHPCISALRPVLALIVLLALLPACTPGGGPDLETLLGARTPGAGERGVNARASSTPSPSPTPVVSRFPVQPAQLKGITLNVWHPWSGAQGEGFTNLLNEFNRTNPWGMIARGVPQAGFDALDDQVQGAITSGGLPDIAVAYAYQALDWEADRPVLVDLEPYGSDPVWGMSEADREDFIQLFWQQDVLNGRRIGIPAGRSAQFLYYNETWARELGFSAPPSSPAQFKIQACAAAQANRDDEVRDNDGTGGWIVSTQYSAIMGWLYAYGAEPLASGGDGYRFDTPEVEQAFTFLRDLYDSGCAWISESQFPEEEFAARQGLMAVGSLAGIAHQQRAMQQAGNGDEWSVIPFPSPRGTPAITAYGPSFFVLESQAERQLGAWLLLRWLMEAGNQARLSQATGLHPGRESSLRLMEGQSAPVRQWFEAAALFDLAQVEPAYRSWGTVRWAVSDAATQLFRYYFTIDQVPVLVKLLEDTANDLRD